MSQIPAGAEGAVAGVMVYCSICLIAALTMIWLSWTHDERTSYVAMISYFSALSIVSSLVQQIHDVVTYESLVTRQFHNTKAHPDHPEIVIANGSTGVSLVLYYIQYWCYSVEAIAFSLFSRAAFLAQSVYGLSGRSRLKVILRRINKGGKIVAMLFPLTTILLLRIPQIQENFVVFILIADLPLMLSLLCGCILMLMIVGRYVQSRRRFLHWSDNVGNSASNMGTSSNNNTNSGSGKTTLTSSLPHANGKQHRNMWDRWLLVRFTIAFLCLSVFEVTNTLFQVMAVTNRDHDAKSSAPDLSAERAKTTWLFFMPGVTPGLFIFIVFGTTTPLRKYMHETLVPKRWQRQHRKDRREDAEAVARSGVHTGPPVPPKDDDMVVVEMQVYRNPALSKNQATSGTYREETSSLGSDEYPILPIQRNNPR
ncbi:hypothetical protein CC79DRAFT_1380030 [Sarocladium strictum]